MKLTWEDIQKIIVEIEEVEAINKDAELYCEHEDAGDRE